MGNIDCNSNMLFQKNLQKPFFTKYMITTNFTQMIYNKIRLWTS